MSDRKILSLVIKIFGLYLVTMFIRAAPLTFILFRFTYDDVKPDYLVFNVLHIVLELIVGCILLLKGEAIAALVVKEETKSTERAGKPPAYTRLWFWITIIGLYYFLSSASTLPDQFLKLMKDYSPASAALNKGGSLLTNVVTVLLSLIFILKSKAIEELIERKKADEPDAYVE